MKPPSQVCIEYAVKLDALYKSFDREAPSEPKPDMVLARNSLRHAYESLWEIALELETQEDAA
jgi:hypothetical protein